MRGRLPAAKGALPPPPAAPRCAQVAVTADVLPAVLLTQGKTLLDCIMLPYFASIHAEVTRRAGSRAPLIVAHMGVGLHRAFIDSFKRFKGSCVKLETTTDNVWIATFGGSGLSFTVVEGCDMHVAGSVRRGAEA